MHELFWLVVLVFFGIWLVVMVLRSSRRGGKERRATGASGNFDPDPAWLAQLDDGRPSAEAHHGEASHAHPASHDAGAHHASSSDHVSTAASHDSGHHGGFDGGSSGGFDGGHHGGGFDGGFDGGHH